MANPPNSTPYPLPKELTEHGWLLIGQSSTSGTLINIRNSGAQQDLKQTNYLLFTAEDRLKKEAFRLIGWSVDEQGVSARFLRD